MHIDIRYKCMYIIYIYIYVYIYEYIYIYIVCIYIYLYVYTYMFGIKKYIYATPKLDRSRLDAQQKKRGKRPLQGWPSLF